MNVRVVASHTYNSQVWKTLDMFCSKCIMRQQHTAYQRRVHLIQNRNWLSVFVIVSHVKAEGLASAITAESKIGSITLSEPRKKEKEHQTVSRGVVSPCTSRLPLVTLSRSHLSNCSSG